MELHTRIKIITDDNFRFRQRLKEVSKNENIAFCYYIDFVNIATHYSTIKFQETISMHLHMYYIINSKNFSFLHKWLYINLYYYYIF